MPKSTLKIIKYYEEKHKGNKKSIKQVLQINDQVGNDQEVAISNQKFSLHKLRWENH